jgi:cyclohexyl-isocyanide hydratase
VTLNIAFVLFPNLTQLDMTGPAQVLHRLPDSKVEYVAATLDPVPSDCGLSLVPTATFETAPQADLLCVPGGFGVEQAMADPAMLAFVRRQAAGARHVTSVCTGAFILGAAGLLRGRKATTHWAYVDLLPLVGAIPTPGRVVRDGDLFTGGGVTAGIDFALTLAAEIAGDTLAQSIQLSIEYDPAPPFAAGHPSRAPEAVKGRITGFYEKRKATFGEAVGRAVAAEGS